MVGLGSFFSYLISKVIMLVLHAFVVDYWPVYVWISRLGDVSIDDDLIIYEIWPVGYVFGEASKQKQRSWYPWCARSQA